MTLLGPNDPPPVEVLRPDGAGPVVLTCEHAARAIPERLGDLGLPPGEIDRHIGWDIGALGVATRLSAMLDAPLAIQPYSRLVVDCNRPLGGINHMPEISDGTGIPANRGLSDADRAARHDAIHQPFHAAVTTLLDARAGNDVTLIAVHSFTPALRTSDAARPWDVGALCRTGAPFVGEFLAGLAEADPALCLALNAPYEIEDDGDYTIPIHAEARGLPHALLEIRQDRIADAAGQARFADLVAAALRRAVAAPA